MLPDRGPGLLFTGDQVLLAVPHLIARAFGADGAKVDPDLPFTIFLDRWDSGELRWATTETDDDMPY
jgi:hypothetical protein